jgi:hypothetical protein
VHVVFEGRVPTPSNRDIAVPGRSSRLAFQSSCPFPHRCLGTRTTNHNQQKQWSAPPLSTKEAITQNWDSSGPQEEPLFLFYEAVFCFFPPSSGVVVVLAQNFTYGVYADADCSTPLDDSTDGGGIELKLEHLQYLGILVQGPRCRRRKTLVLVSR